MFQVVKETETIVDNEYPITEEMCLHLMLVVLVINHMI